MFAGDIETSSPHGLSYAPSGALHDVVGLTHGFASLHHGLLSLPPSGGRRSEENETATLTGLRSCHSVSQRLWGASPWACAQG